MPFRPRTSTPRLWQLTSQRAFSATSAVAVGARVGSRGVPTFDWRRPYKNFPKPSVTLISDEAAANAYLESLTSKRLTFEGDTDAVARANRTRESGYSGGVMSIADGEGVMILHFAPMKRVPEMLKTILADSTIEKQMFGAASLLHQIVNKESEFFDFCEPVNFLDLRLLASSLYPRLERIGRGMPNFDFVTEFAKDGMGLRLEYLLRQEQAYAVKKLSREVLDERINCCWLSHCASFHLRSRLESKIQQTLGKKIASIMGENERMAEPGEEDKKLLTAMLMRKSLDSFRVHASDVRGVPSGR